MNENRIHSFDSALSAEGAGWVVTQSIALEIDTALTAASGYFPASSIPQELGALLAALPEDWLSQWPDLMGTRRGFQSVLVPMASLAGVLLEDDYNRATLAMRELTLETALAALARQAEPYELSPAPGLSAAERFAELAARLTLQLYRRYGFELSDEEALRRVSQAEHGLVIRFLGDGDLHVRFWHWLDRFFYEIYQPWRRTRREALAMLEQHAATMLGAARSDGTAPVLDWLPAQNPLRVHARLEEAVRGGRLRVCFWAEPFGMADLSSLHPGCVLVAFAHPGPLYQNFLDFAGDLAGRAKAVADPTRLIILRLIRHFGMTNTEIANFMEIARPTASVHAKILREAGLIRSHQDGREVRHQIVPAGVRQLFADLERFLDLPEA